MATTIKVNGKDLKLAFTLHTAISYEKMTGKNSLDLKQFEFEKSGSIEPVITLGYCMIASANDEKDIPGFEEYLKAFSSMDQMADLIKKVMEELATFFKPTAADKAEKQEDAAKNGSRPSKSTKKS